MELKLLSVAVQHAAAVGRAAAPRREVVEASVLRAELEQMEARFAASLNTQEQKFEEMQRASSLTIEALTAQLAESVAARERVAKDVAEEFVQLEARLSTRLQVQSQVQENQVAELQQSNDEAVGALRYHVSEALTLHTKLAESEANLAERLQLQEEKVANIQQANGEALGTLKSADETTEAQLLELNRGMEAAGARLSRFERNLEELEQKDSVFERSIAADLVDIEAALKAQSAGLESARTGLSQTDDLVERVVEALESLQTAILDQAEAGGGQPFAAAN
jgi:chromosome segregation ATPase